MDGFEIDAVEIGSMALSPEMDLDEASVSESSFASAEEMEEVEVIPWCYNCHHMSTKVWCRYGDQLGSPSIL